MSNEQLTGTYAADIEQMNRDLRVDASYDVIGRVIEIGGRQARMYFIDGFVKDSVMEKIMEYLMALEPRAVDTASDAQAFSEKFVTYVEADTTGERGRIITGVLSGTIALLIEGYSEAIMIDARTYPARGVEEPNDDKVLRGSRDGFVETLVHNTALIRRRIRDPRLTMEITSAGKQSKTDIVICYMKGKADETLLARVREKLAAIEAGMLAMSQESLAECLVKPQWYNPFPKVRYTERPDAASASVAEGSVLIVIDNSPSVMVLPTCLFDFVQDTNDYYFPPLVGTYLRMVRISVFLLTLLLTPIWFLLIQNPEIIPPWLDFIRVAEPNSVPVFWQLIIVEFVIDGLKLASLNTPSVLSSSFSVVGALILGDFAVRANWFVPEVVLYMAFVAIANFTQPSFELGYAFKLFRVLLLILTALLNFWGFALGVALMTAVAASTKTISGRGYLYPFIPFSGRSILRLFVRVPIQQKDS